MAPTRILILADRRPGHFNLSEGIAAAIERLGPATTQRCEVQRGRWPGAVLAALTRARLPARALLASVYGIDEPTLPTCDVVVSAGAETLAANVWLARARRVPNVFYGSLRLYDPLDFSLVLTSYTRNAGKPRHSLALKPSRLDPDTLRETSETGPQRPAHFGLLVGGDAGPIRFANPDWEGLLRLLAPSPKADIGAPRWLVANSRRTPTWVSDALAAAAEVPGSPVDSYLDVRTAGPGTLPLLLARCSAVLCTADSSSMISECIWARLPTLALAPTECPFSPDEAEYRRWLEQSGWCRQLPLTDLDQKSVRAMLATVAPLQHNPLEALARLLRDRLPALDIRSSS